MRKAQTEIGLQPSRANSSHDVQYLWFYLGHWLCLNKLRNPFLSSSILCNTSSVSLGTASLVFSIPWWRSHVSISPVSWTLGSILSFIFTALSKMGPRVPRVALPCSSLQHPQARDLLFQINLHLCKLEPLMGGVFPSRHFPSCPLVNLILACTSASVYQLRLLCPPCTPPPPFFLWL